MKMTGIIFSEMYSDALNSFTQDRNMAAIPFGGRYRLVDFVLSNMVNSGILNVGVLAKQHYHSLMDHLGNSQEWDLNRKNGGLQLLPPFATEDANTGGSRGKLDELRNALDYLETISKTPYVLLADAYVLCNIDYRAALEDHIASGCDITMLATKEAGDSPINFSSVMQADANHKVTSYALDYPAKPGDYAGMGHVIISREFLINVIRDYTARGIYDFQRDFIQHEFNRNRLSINLYEVDTKVLRVRDVNEYFQSSLAILDDDVAAALFRGDRPIHTRVTDEVPAYYGLDCQVERSIIADGCFIDGNVENCVLSRGVKIGKGAKVKNCVIMQGSVVGEGACLENVIVDKWVNISYGAQLRGLDSNPVVIRKGVTV
ncbi:MAG: glucose-1-phosphate adenylyltransferase subunit GlgD [Oscillospiraceae bacterium]|nr:glucose-1-phosphate adenylyltransferase subunit GlgD [Oscillospiraceae bacterium]